VALVKGLNAYQRRVVNTMLSGYSAGRYRPRPLIQTKTFERLASRSLANAEGSVDQLEKLEVIDRKLARALQGFGVRTVAELFRRDIGTLKDADRSQVMRARERVIAHARLAKRRPPNP
jgi:hypothetical protein